MQYKRIILFKESGGYITTDESGILIAVVYNKEGQRITTEQAQIMLATNDILPSIIKTLDIDERKQKVYDYTEMDTDLLEGYCEICYELGINYFTGLATRLNGKLPIRVAYHYKDKEEGNDMIVTELESEKKPYLLINRDMDTGKITIEIKEKE
ncbi:MAG: hypothetical protein BWX46_00804 [Candidatus Cloacimonetes bacterium ADurb.Bin003]|nr:MAG: hypothetical protein BWX46_00804 [Candidatus Cloacimonetes bacterium ADurb.Bin003]